MTDDIIMNIRIIRTPKGISSEINGMITNEAEAIGVSAILAEALQRTTAVAVKYQGESHIEDRSSTYKIRRGVEDLR